MTKLPAVLNNYNIYDEIEKLVGTDGAIDMPDIAMLTEKLSGSGIAGEVEEAAVGQFQSMEMKIRWRCLSKDYFKAANTAKASQFTLRGSIQYDDSETGATGYYHCKIVVRGKAKTLALGSWEAGKKMECETTLELLYIKVIIDNDTVLELDKLNFKFILNGEDLLEEIRSQI